jgi:hypothetical protein
LLEKGLELCGGTKFSPNQLQFSNLPNTS